MKKILSIGIAIIILNVLSAKAYAAETLESGLIFVPEGNSITDYLQKDVAVYVDEASVREHKKGIKYVYDPALLNGDYMELMKSSADANGYTQEQSTANIKAQKEAYALVDDVSIKNKVNYVEIGAKGYFYDYVNLSGFDAGLDITVVSVMYDLSKQQPVKINGRYLIAKETFTTKGFVNQNVTMPFQMISKKIPKDMIDNYSDNPIHFNIPNTKPLKLITSDYSPGEWTAFRTVIVENHAVVEKKDTVAKDIDESNMVSFVTNGEKSGDVAHTIMAKEVSDKQAVENVRKKAEIHENEVEALEKRLAIQAKEKEKLPQLSSSSPTEISHNWLYKIIYYFFQ